MVASFADVNKSYNGDDEMCGAATAANMIVAAGHADSAQQVYDDILSITDRAVYPAWAISRYNSSLTYLITYQTHQDKIINSIYSALESGQAVALEISLVTANVEIYHAINVYDIEDMFDNTFRIWYATADDMQNQLLRGLIIWTGYHWETRIINMTGYRINRVVCLSPKVAWNILKKERTIALTHPRSSNLGQLSA